MESTPLEERLAACSNVTERISLALSAALGTEERPMLSSFSLVSVWLTRDGGEAISLSVGRGDGGSLGSWDVRGHMHWALDKLSSPAQ
jgi:hypothetical protein